MKIVRKIRKSSEYSYAINLPKEIMDQYNWKAGQKITIEDKGRGKVEIKDWRKR